MLAHDGGAEVSETEKDNMMQDPGGGDDCRRGG
jgi:hypothetical protein